jgi:RNA polymerase sigma-70 factor (ECF subfamily)
MTASEPENSHDFESHRSFLRGLAYRMLGSRSAAEDAVQDTWLRWHEADRGTVKNPRAFLAQITTRLCLDRLKSAQAQREVYVGEWLPEPLVDDLESFQPGPEVATELASDLSFAFLMVLERLSLLERAAFLLHDVFDLDFLEIAQTLGKSEAACRQLAKRARDNIRGERPRFTVCQEEATRIATAFGMAVNQGNIAALAAVLAEDAKFVSDGGGKVNAVPKAIVGRDRVAQVVIGFARLIDPANIRIRYVFINGLPGCVMSDTDSNVIQTLAIEPGPNGKISGIYVMRNPDKLQRISTQGR